MDVDAYMASRGLKDGEVAAALGVNRTTVSRIRRGVKGAGLELSLRLVQWSRGEISHTDMIRTALNGRRGKIAEPVE